jgi:hypothetical protein
MGREEERDIRERAREKIGTKESKQEAEIQ